MARRDSLPVAHLAAGLLAAMLAAGCRTAPLKPKPVSVQFDACSERLHDVCGRLLAYYAAHKKLPPTVEELAASSSAPRPPLVCPVSNKPYVNNATGLRIPSRQGRLVLYDAEATHSAMRWGILVSTPAGGGFMTANVVLLSAEEFASAVE